MFTVAKTSYTAKAEVYLMYIEQSRSGQRLERWDYENPAAEIDCLIREFSTSTLRGVTNESISRRSLEGDLLVMRTSAKLSEDDRVGNIRNKKTGRVLRVDYVRNELNPSEVIETPITFEIVGSYPVEDFFGHILEYVYVLEAARD